MSKITWLLQDSHQEKSETIELGRVINELNSKYSLVKLKGFSKEIPEIHNISDDEIIICKGASWVPRALSCSFKPGIWFNEKTFRWSSFKEGWENMMLSHDGVLLKLSEAKKILESSNAMSFFIRPDEDLKLFEGGVYNALSFDACLAAPWSYTTNSTPVIIATPVPILAEWRIFVVNKEIVAASEYRYLGKPSTKGFIPNKVINFAYDAIEKWTPASVFCLDIAQTENNYSIVEANCFNAARLYAGDVHRIVSSIEEFCTEYYS